jgi:hypothetical protein
MNSITLEQAEEYINELNKVVIVLEAEGINPETENYVTMLEKGLEGVDWDLYRVNIIYDMNNRVRNSKPPLIFEPDLYPMTYIFKAKERLAVIGKVLSASELISILEEIDEGAFSIHQWQ